MKNSGHWIDKKAAASLHPSQVESALEQLNNNWPSAEEALVDVIEQFPLGEAALLHLLAMSSVCAARLVRSPELLQWLSRPEISQTSRSYGEMSNGLYWLSGGTDRRKQFPSSASLERH